MLAPTLFWVFINDLLTLSLSLSAHDYADDTKFTCSHSDSLELERLCSVYLEKIYEWCVLNKMTMNIKKSHFFVFGKPKNEMCPKVGNDILSQANNTKLLDFYLNVSMTLYEHV